MDGPDLAEEPLLSFLGVQGAIERLCVIYAPQKRIEFLKWKQTDGRVSMGSGWKSEEDISAWERPRDQRREMARSFGSLGGIGGVTGSGGRSTALICDGLERIGSRLSHKIMGCSDMAAPLALCAGAGSDCSETDFFMPGPAALIFRLS